MTTSPDPEATAPAGSEQLPITEKHACSCGESHEAIPTLDARTIPHAIRHATIFGALDAVGVGESMILVAPHDPQPLLAQIAQREQGAIEVSYLQRGPEDWRLKFTRR